MSGCGYPNGGADDRAVALPEPIAEVSGDFISALTQAGIEIAEPFGRVEVDEAREYACVGFITVWDDGGVTAVYASDATAWQVGAVLLQAEATLLEGVTGPWWRPLPGQGWQCSVLEPVSAAPAPTSPASPAAHLYCGP